jgi:hypothetical protein
MIMYISRKKSNVMYGLQDQGSNVLPGVHYSAFSDSELLMLIMEHAHVSSRAISEVNGVEY